jgi:acetyl esterase/lipase
MSAKLCMRIAEQGFVAVNLEYGLAPEHPFPWRAVSHRSENGFGLSIN